MKKMICLLSALILTAALCLGASAEEMTIDQHAVINGMEKSWYQGYAPTIHRGTMTLYLPLRGDFTGKATVSIALDDPDVFLLTRSPREVTVSPDDGLYPVRLILQLDPYRRNGDYPATVTVKGVNASGSAVTAQFPYVIRVRDGYRSHETLQPVISQVSGSLNVGSDGSVFLTVANPTTTLSMTDCVLTVTEETGEVLMSGSNRMALPEILPGQSQTVTVPMTVKGSAAVSQHTLNVELSYRVLDKEAKWTESFTLPVTQEIRLEQGTLQLPTAVAGELGTMTLPLMNMGKGELRNVLVKLTAEGIAQQSVLVGTMAPGESKQAKLTFTPNSDQAGSHPASVTVSCEDVYGNAAQTALDVTIQVDPPLPQVEAAQDEQKAPVRPWTVVLIALCVLLAAGLIAQGTILTGKLHRLEEERL